MIRVVALSLVLVCGLVFSLPYGKDSGVIPLTKANFAKEVFGSEHVWLVEFYAPWCGHCKNLAPEYEKLAKSMKGIVKIGAVNGDDEKELCSQYGIKGFPTLKVFPSKVKSDGKKAWKEPTDYNGQRTAAAMSEYLTSQLPNFVSSVNAKNHESFLETNATLPKALLFTNKKEITPMFKSLAIEYHYGINFGAVKDTEKTLVEQYKVEKFPTLVVIPAGAGSEPNVYAGELKFDALLKYLKPFAPSSGKSDQGSAKEQPKKEKVLRNAREEVKDQKTFEALCYDQAASCVVVLLEPENTGPESQEKYLTTLDNINKKNGDKFTFLWIDGMKQYEFAEKLNVATGYPSVFIINQRKMALVSYRGAFEESALQQFLDSTLRGATRPHEIKSIPTLVVADKDEL